MYILRLGEIETKSITEKTEVIIAVLEKNKTTTGIPQIIKRIEFFSARLKNCTPDRKIISPKFSPCEAGQIAMALLASYFYLKDESTLANEPLRELWKHWNRLIVSQEAYMKLAENDKDSAKIRERRILEFYEGFADITRTYQIPFAFCHPWLKTMPGKIQIDKLKAEAKNPGWFYLPGDGTQFLAKDEMAKGILKLLIPNGCSLDVRKKGNTDSLRPLRARMNAMQLRHTKAVE